MVSQDLMKVATYIWMTKRKKDQQPVWIVIFMVAEEVWNKLISYYCASVEKDRSYEIGRS